METGKYSQLKTEMKEIIHKLYQNQQDEAYPWIGAHIQEIKASLLEQIVYYVEKGETDVTIQEQAVTILEHLIQAYQNHQMMELADCLNYEYGRYMGWEI